MLPYLCRLRDLGQHLLWEEGGPFPPIAAWLDRCYARSGYLGIADYLDAKYLDVMADAGARAEPRLRVLLAR